MKHSHTGETRLRNEIEICWGRKENLGDIRGFFLFFPSVVQGQDGPGVKIRLRERLCEGLNEPELFMCRRTGVLFRLLGSLLS
jgi:hypothetical protein